MQRVSQMKKIELLAPAGDFESAKAAVIAGASAVYLGALQFSARQNATNFDENELSEIVSYCHIRGVKVYLALNTLVFDSQLEEVSTVIKNACSISVDALIVQDLGVVSIIKEICPTMPIHASTQMAVHTKKGAQLLCSYGIKRVVLAREMTLAEIADITKNIDIEVEVFTHGALCMSLSGQCYISGMIGGRSGNRGNCAGTCRLPFSPTGQKEQYALSLKDNCQAEHVAELMQAGVTSLKIEGRMKRHEYVACAVDTYKKAIDGQEYDLETLRAVFSRDGFTDAYLTDSISAEMYGYRRKQDVISATPKLLKQIENSFRKEVPLVGLSFDITIKANQQATLTVTDQDGNVATACGEIAEVAQNTPSTLESLSRSLKKLGGTPFFVTELTGAIDDGLILSASAVNELRRDVCDKIMALREVRPNTPCGEYHFDTPPKRQTGDAVLRARFSTVSQVVDAGFSHIILPSSEILANRQDVASYLDRLVVEPDRLLLGCEQDEFTRLAQAYEMGCRYLMCSNLAHIQMGKELGYTLIGDTFLNCLNTPCAEQLHLLGLSELTLSFEGELKEIRTVQVDIPTGIIAYGYLPLMLMKSCPIKAKISCNDCTASLVDRLSTFFPVYCHNKRYIEVLNSTPLYLADRQHELPFDFLTLYFTNETEQQVANIIDSYTAKTPSAEQFTRGLYYRTI